MSVFKIIECPRDAMQGIPNIISTEKKIEYLRSLLQVGFHTLDFGSFVSPKAVPQMADTYEVIQSLEEDPKTFTTKLLAIVANLRGAEEALKFKKIDYLGYPLSVSETFQIRNTGKSIAESLEIVKDIQWLSQDQNRKLVIYLSMGFGNPYNDPYNSSVVLKMIEHVGKLGIDTISIADTVGIASNIEVEKLLKEAVISFPKVEIGAHLHSRPKDVREKVLAVSNSGCLRIDSAILGLGGCPFAEDTLVGNLDTETVIRTLRDQGFDLKLSDDSLNHSLQLAHTTF